MATLLLVDGSSYLYRAFHALPDLRNSKNEPTGAIYGVINMLRRLANENRADYTACVFDAKGKTFRDDWYPEYKANRAAMPGDLALQIEPIHETVKALGWPLIMMDGVEADDVIGTLAKIASEKGINTIISTGDKDIAQLVNDKVTLVNTMTNERFDMDGVLKKFGVSPSQIIEYLALVGDSVDNIRGVDKVGPKTAVKLLAEYGSLDNIISNANNVKGAVGENLRKACEWLPLSRKLITIKCDLELPVGLDDIKLGKPDNIKLLELYERFQFKTWTRELRALVNGEIPTNDELIDRQTSIIRPSIERHYETIFTHEQLDKWFEAINRADLVCVDTETTSLDQMQAKLVGISICIEPGKAAYLPLAHRYTGAPEQISLEVALEKLRPWLENENHRKLFQNAKYDVHVFANHGIKVQGISHDTLLQSYVLESHKPHDMDSMASRHLDMDTIKYEDVAGKGASQIGFDQVDIARAAEYSAEDTDVTLQLHQTLFPRIVNEEKLNFIYQQIEMPVMEVLLRIERNGVLLDVKKLDEQSHQLGKRMMELEQETHQQAGQPFNLNSPKQIQEILFNIQKLPVKKKTPSGTPSTDEEVLAELALDYPLPKLLLEYRGIAKLKSTYTDKLPKMINPVTGRVHTNYGQAVAITGRLSSNDPNLQNIPIRTAEGRRVREAFVAAPGSKIISADYSQVELRIMAHLSEDEGLLKAFSAGEDIHRATGSEIFSVDPTILTSEQRRYAKVINFGLIYGMSAFGLAANLGIERSAAQAYIEKYFSRYPGVKNYMDKTRAEARDQGYVETVFGRKLFLTEIRSGNMARRQAAERAAINAPMQGTAADIIKLAMIVVQKWLDEKNMQTKMIMQVHDELVFEVVESEVEIIQRELPGLMCGVANLKVPLAVDVGIGDNWEKAH